MAFVYDRERHRAIDPDIKSELYETKRIRDYPSIPEYYFARYDMWMEFKVFPREKVIEYIDEKTGEKKVRSTAYAYYIPEEQIYNCAWNSYNGKKSPIFSKEDYRKLKIQICEALFVLLTQRGAGNRLKFVPDFYVQITPSKSIPPQDAMLRSKKNVSLLSKLVDFFTKKRGVRN